MYEEEGLFARAAGLADYWQAAVHRLADARHVIDVRNMGLVAGIEMAPLQGKDGAKPGARGQALFRHLFDHGLLARATGDIIALSPPLIVSEAEIDAMVEMLAAGLDVTE